MKKAPFLLVSLLSMGLLFLFTSEGNSIGYESAYQRIVSTSPGWPMLFRLNVTYPYEPKAGENFSVVLQLWQAANTTAYVSLIYVWMPNNLAQDLIKNQTLQNLQQTETLVVNKTLTINVPERQSIYIDVYYSVKDLSFPTYPTWATGSNHLASIHVYSQTYDELTRQATNLEEQVSDLQTQQWAFIFLTAYLIVTLGIVVPTVQKRRKSRLIQSK